MDGNNYLFNPHYAIGTVTSRGGRRHRGGGYRSNSNNFGVALLPTPPQPPQASSTYLHLFRDYISKPEDLVEDPHFLPFCSLPLPQQFQEWFLAIPLSSLEIENRHLVLADLHSTLVPGYPRGSLHPFGSFLTGLGDFGSDLDIYFESESNQGPRNLLNKVVRLLRSANTVDEWDGGSIPMFTEIVPIPQAKVPIVKFVHEETGICGDISFHNMIALRNSDLLKLFRELHPVVQPLIVLVKYWAKWNEFSGSSLIKNYTLALMALVFLAREGIVPSVEQVKMLERGQRRRGEEGRHVYNGWDTGFATNLQQIRATYPSSQDPQEYYASPRKDTIIFNLFRGFCNFYANANFSTHFLSTLTAEFVLKSHFHGNPNIPSFIRRSLRTFSEMCVQDPFCLDFNVSLPTSGLTLVAFQSACHQTLLRLGSSVPIQNFFDIFVPIPSPLLNKDFVNSRLKYLKKLELKVEVETALKSDFNGDQEVSSLIPLHFMTLEQLADWQRIRYEMERDGGVFNISSSGKTFRGISLSCDALALKFRWVGIVQDYAVHFWTWGLGLDVTIDRFDRVQECNEEESDDDVSLLAPPRKKQRIQDPNEINNGVLILKLSCSGSLPHPDVMADVRKKVMGILHPKPDSETVPTRTESPLELLSSILGKAEKSKTEIFCVYVKLEKCLEPQSSSWPMVQIMGDQVDVSALGFPSIVPLLLSMLVAMFPTYLKYRATATSTQPSHATVVAKVSEPSNVVHKTPTPSTSRQEMPTMPTQSDFKAKTILPSSPSSNFLPTQLGLGEEDPKLKNQPFSNKIMENSNSSLRNSISIQLSPVQPKSSQEKVPVITLD